MLGASGGPQRQQPMVGIGQRAAAAVNPDLFAFPGGRGVGLCSVPKLVTSSRRPGTEQS